MTSLIVTVGCPAAKGTSTTQYRSGPTGGFGPVAKELERKQQQGQKRKRQSKKAAAATTTGTRLGSELRDVQAKDVDELKSTYQQLAQYVVDQDLSLLLRRGCPGNSQPATYQPTCSLGALGSSNLADDFKCPDDYQRFVHRYVVPPGTTMERKESQQLQPQQASSVERQLNRRLFVCCKPPAAAAEQPPASKIRKTETGRRRVTRRSTSSSSSSSQAFVI